MVTSHWKQYCIFLKCTMGHKTWVEARVILEYLFFGICFSDFRAWFTQYTLSKQYTPIVSRNITKLKRGKQISLCGSSTYWSSPWKCPTKQLKPSFTDTKINSQSKFFNQFFRLLKCNNDIKCQFDLLKLEVFRMVTESFRYTPNVSTTYLYAYNVFFDHSLFTSRTIHYEGGAVSSHARSLWKLETLRVVWVEKKQTFVHWYAFTQRCNLYVW